MFSVSNISIYLYSTGCIVPAPVSLCGTTESTRVSLGLGSVCAMASDRPQKQAIFTQAPRRKDQKPITCSLLWPSPAPIQITWSGLGDKSVGGWRRGVGRRGVSS